MFYLRIEIEGKYEDISIYGPFLLAGRKPIWKMIILLGFRFGKSEMLLVNYCTESALMKMDPIWVCGKMRSGGEWK